MTPEEIKGLALTGESETLEFKATTGSRREGAMSSCAMLNHRGGHVVFGVTQGGNVVGQQVGEGTIEDVIAEIQRIEPPVFPTVDRVPVNDDGWGVIVVSLQQGQTRPYSYRGTAYQRVGNTNRAMTRDEYNQMLFERMHSVQRWENQPASGWSIDDLDEAEIRRTVEESIRRGRLEDPGVRGTEDLLRGLGLIKNGELLRAAVVLFGASERVAADMPQCLLRVARFRGVGRTEFLDNRQFRGNAFVLLMMAERFMVENLPVAGRIVSDRFERVDEPLYPPEALREALANALCHRDYSIGGGSVGAAIYDDRLEVTSSGTLHFGLTPDLLFAPHESLAWNPLIAGVFYRRGIIEQWGRGTIKMAELTEAVGLPQPEIEDEAGSVTVRFRLSRYLPPRRVGRDLTARQQAILALLHEADTGMALREIRSELGPQTSARQLHRDLVALRALELVLTAGHGRGARWRLL